MYFFAGASYLKLILINWFFSMKISLQILQYEKSEKQATIILISLLVIRICVRTYYYFIDIVVQM